jgi:ornithine carbamoyltransferase
MDLLTQPLPVELTGHDLLRPSDLVPAESEAVLALAARLKTRPRHEPLLPGRTLGLLFFKPSTRTRVSFAAGMTQLGGAAIPLHPEELQLSRGESLADTARVLSGYLDAIAIRTYAHRDVEEWAEAASIPVLNALTDEQHPCQALADALTIRERVGGTEGVRIAWVGDGTNVLVSLAELGSQLGITIVAACPPGYEPSDDASLRSFELVRDPREAVAGADVVVTDTWTSMGHKGERERRLRDLESYRLDAALLELAHPEAIVLHCLPAHPGEEITAEVLYGPRSAVWQEAENRLHVHKALLALLLGETTSARPSASSTASPRRAARRT